MESALSLYSHLQVSRTGNTVIARTDFGRNQRVVIGGHLGHRPGARQPSPSTDRRPGLRLGACDMKGGVAVALRLAAHVTDARYDVTYLFYDCEEVASDHNGSPSWHRQIPPLAADFAIPMEPSNARVEAIVRGLCGSGFSRGARAQRAGLMGDNAIHNAAEILNV